MNCPLCGINTTELLRLELDLKLTQDQCKLEQDEIARLKRAIIKKDAAFQRVIDSTMHPDIALRAVLVPLNPVREALQYKGEPQ